MTSTKIQNNKTDSDAVPSAEWNWIADLFNATTRTTDFVIYGTIDATEINASSSMKIGGVAVPTVSSTSTLTNKTLTSPIISTINNIGTLTLPTSTDTLVGRATTDTLTNKTISAGTIASDLDFNGTDAKDLALGTFKRYDAGNSGTSLTIDWNNGAMQKVTLTGNCTFTFTAPTVDTNNWVRLQLVLYQDGTGSRTATWPATVKHAGGSAPTLTTTPSRADIITLIYNGTNYAAVSSLNFAI